MTAALDRNRAILVVEDFRAGLCASDVRRREIFCIMVAAESKADNLIAATRAGVSNSIFQPFAAHTLCATIAQVAIHA
jgi:DNA-binding NtrC family response regulator